MSVLAVVLAVALEAAPSCAVSVDAGNLAAAALGGDVLVPIAFEGRLIQHLSWTGEGHLAVGLGPGRGLYSLGARIGLRWSPFSATPLTGFWIGPRLGADVVVTDNPVFIGVRPTLGLSLGYSFLLGERLQLSPGIDINPIGLGFPVPGLVVLRLGVGLAF